jgi:tRNA U34 5-methylaminomethyl-2-thiouridine-forming methyltransferase MnmC
MSNNKVLKREIIQTDDGSHSLFVPSLNENYHSTHGAKQEAEHIFIKDALAYNAEKKQVLNVLEIGFGTGLNAFLTLQYSQNNDLEVHYYGVEKYPVSEIEYTQLNYAAGDKMLKKQFVALHNAVWGQEFEISHQFYIKKIQSDFREMKLPTDYFDVVYFDAFGPDVQPELWSEDIFKNIYQSMKNGGVLTTYSVKGDVRRAMKSVGFEVKKIPGPPGKREITRAVKAI